MARSFLSLLFLLALILDPNSTFSQQQVVTGVVTDKSTGSTMVGVVVRIKNTSTGSVTDINGAFSITITSPADTLLFSFMGYREETIPVMNRKVIDVAMEESAVQLTGVVVTALGIPREEKSLGYAVTEIEGDQLQTSKDLNVINQLSGKVAGLEVSSSNGGAASSSNIVLRGNKSFTGSNQALIVVDGIPIDNSTESNAGATWGGRDYGSGISDINPDDIESISILKGGSAAALYGSRASNGVILITTKKGASGKKIQITFNSNSAVESPVILWQLQNKYGAGRNGKFEGPWNTSGSVPVFDPTNASSYGSWGPEMLDQKIIDWDGKESTFSPQPDNYRNYFRTGLTFNNSLSVGGGSKNKTYRFTFTNLENNDIVPNSCVSRTNISANFGAKLFRNISLSFFGSYITQKYNNRFGLSDDHTNVNRNYIMMPRNISNESLEDNLMDANGKELSWYRNWNWMTNPFWNELYELNEDKRNRCFFNVSLLFDLDTNLTLSFRVAPDFTRHDLSSREAYNGLVNSLGSYNQTAINRNQFNSDVLLSYIFRKNKWSIGANAGGNAMYDNTTREIQSTQGGLAIPYEYSIENSLNAPYDRLLLFEKAILSAYASTQFGYGGFIYLDITARNDWSSTLPKHNNSYFYPSFSSGFVFTELLHLSKKMEHVFSFGKLRASWAAVGNDTDPYQLSKTYYVDSTGSFGTIAYVSGTIPPFDLKPEKLVSREGGLDLRFFSGRLGIDFTYYHSNSYNQIVRIDISPASGSRYALINAGNIENKGVELQLNAKILERKKLKWQSTLAYSRNRSMVIELAEGIDNLQLMEHWGLSIEARPGHPYGDIVGYAIERDDQGRKLVDANGMYIRSAEKQVLGNINPKFKISLNNSFTWKKFTLSFLTDAKIGGQIFAGTNMYGYGYSGNFEETLEGREEWYQSEQQREEAGVDPEDWVATGGYLADGVFADGTSNNVYVNPEKYWGQFSDWTNEIHEPFVYDASYVKLREITLTWELPAKWFSRAKFNHFYLSVYCRNVLLLFSKVPNIDPEAYHNSENGQGYELYSYPGRRTVGLNLKINL